MSVSVCVCAAYIERFVWVAGAFNDARIYTYSANGKKNNNNKKIAIFEAIAPRSNKYAVFHSWPYCSMTFE